MHFNQDKLLRCNNFNIKKMEIKEEYIEQKPDKQQVPTILISHRYQTISYEVDICLFRREKNLLRWSPRMECQSTKLAEYSKSMDLLRRILSGTTEKMALFSREKEKKKMIVKSPILQKKISIKLKWKNHKNQNSSKKYPQQKIQLRRREIIKTFIPSLIQETLCGTPILTQ